MFISLKMAELEGSLTGISGAVEVLLLYQQRF